MKKALLLVDRGSKAPEVLSELSEVCDRVKELRNYWSTKFCFLEVRPPFIQEGINDCINSGADFITVVPYFLYPGMKLKDAVKRCAAFANQGKVKMVISKPLSYHPTLPALVNERIQQCKLGHDIDLPDAQCDILLIGHGSSEKSARTAFLYVAESIRMCYRSVTPCFLELDMPNIEEGVYLATKQKPKVLIAMPYFLHQGVHVKVDVQKELDAALGKFDMRKVLLAGHLGTHRAMIDLVAERSREVEERANVR